MDKQKQIVIWSVINAILLIIMAGLFAISLIIGSWGLAILALIVAAVFIVIPPHSKDFKRKSEYDDAAAWEMINTEGLDQDQSDEVSPDEP